MDPLVSIIVPCYNHERYVDACIKSIIGQTYKNIELVVLDDGSKDSSLAVLKKLSEENGFMLIHHANMGFIKTINKGLKAAHGKYYAVFASDDWMPPDRIERQVRHLEANPGMAACGGNCIAIDENSMVLAKQKSYPLRTLTFEDLFFDRKPGIPAPTALIRTEPVKAIGGYREDIGIEDLWMWLRLTSSGYTIGVLDTVEAHYRQHGTNMHNRLRYMVESMLKIYDEYKDYPGYKDVVNRFLLSSFTRASRHDKKLAKQILQHYTGGRCNRRFIKSLAALYLLPQKGVPANQGFGYNW